MKKAVIFLVLLAALLIKIVFMTGIIKSEGRTNILVATRPVLVISLNHDDQSVQIVSIPTTAQIEVAGSYGRYLAEKVFALDQLEKKNGRLFMDSFSRMLGVPIDGYILSSRQSVAKDENRLNKEDLLKFRTSFWQNFSVKNTNLSIYDQLRMFVFISMTKASKVNYLNLYQSGALQTLNLPDGSRVLATDTIRTDAVIKDFLNETKILQENLNVEVLNATDFSGLAENIARMLTNLGFLVLTTGNEKGEVAVCKIYVKKEAAASYSVKRLVEYFGCQKNVSQRTGSRTDISLVLGTAIKNRFKVR